MAGCEVGGRGSARCVCSGVGTALLYEGKGSQPMVNIPRALFTGGTGREPRYHVAIEELQDWAYTGKRLVPLKGYPDIVWERPKSASARVRSIILSSSIDAFGPHVLKSFSECNTSAGQCLSEKRRAI